MYVVPWSAHASTPLECGQTYTARLTTGPLHLHIQDVKAFFTHSGRGERRRATVGQIIGTILRTCTRWIRPSNPDGAAALPHGLHGRHDSCRSLTPGTVRRCDTTQPIFTPNHGPSPRSRSELVLDGCLEGALRARGGESSSFHRER